MVHFFGILSNIIYGLLFRQIKLYNVCANLESSLCSILSMLVRAKKFNVQKKWVQSHTQKQLAINYTIFFDTVNFSFFQEAKPISKLIFFFIKYLNFAPSLWLFWFLYHKVASSRPVCNSILNSFGHRSQYRHNHHISTKICQ